MRCPECDSRLRIDQTYVDSRPDGLGPLGTEVTYLVSVWACRECGYTREETT